MKKLFVALLAAALLISIAACGQKNQEKDPGKEDPGTPDEETLLGAWERTESPVVTEELKTMMETAQKDLTGAKYTPVAYLATQVVAGRNHAVLCRLAPVVPDAEETYAVTILYEDPAGNVTISDVWNFGAETYLYGKDLAGGWSQPETPVITEEARKAFDKAMEGFTGVGYEPVALLSTQLVSGMNYRYICEATTVLPGAETSYALVTVYQDLEGNAQITEIVRLPEENGSGDAEGKKMTPEEAEYEIKAAMQFKLEDMYGDSIDDARIYVEKVYTEQEEQEIEVLQELQLGSDEYAFSVRYELHPAEGTDINVLTAANGTFDEESGWILEKYGVGVLRPDAGGEHAYVITDFGTGF